MNSKWDKSLFEQYLYGLVAKKIDDTTWRKQILYSLEAGGKRFRPALCFIAGECLGMSQKVLFQIGSSLELIHTASLIHDDLPEIDNDSFRRGKASHHKKYDHGTAVIAGDFMFFLAFEIISELGNADLCGAFSKTSMNLAYGEYLDIIMEDLSSKEIEKVKEMYRYKTANLIQLSLSAPALVLMKPKSHIDLMMIAGNKLGTAFQILDDLKGIHGNFQEIGKTPGKDILNKKDNLVSLLGHQASQEIVESNREEFFSCLQKIRDVDQSDYERLSQYVREMWNIIVNK